MEEIEVRRFLEDVQGALKGNEEEHESLLSLLKGLEGWLRIHADRNGYPAEQLPLTPSSRDIPRNQTKGTIPLRQAMRQVLKDARGEALHVKEIWRRAQALGAVTTAKNVMGIVDLTCHSFIDEGSEKVAPRTWRWVDKVGNNLVDSVVHLCYNLDR